MTDMNESPASAAANDALRDVDLSIPARTPVEAALSLPYCICGNEQTTHTPDTGIWVGPLCEPFLKGPLNMAYDAFCVISQQWGRHCGSVSSDISFARTLEERIQKFSTTTHLYIHPKSHGESSYYIPRGYCLDCGHPHTGGDDTCIAPVSTGDGPNDVDICPCNAFRPPATREPDMWVECGVRLYADYAQPYWVFDNDKIDTHGEVFGDRVPYSMGGEEFLAAVATQLDDAAYHAYMADYALCPVCHSTYYAPNGPCCEDGEEDTDVTDTGFYAKTYHFKMDCTVTLYEKADPPETRDWLLAKALMGQLNELEYGAIAYMIDEDSVYSDDEDDESSVSQ